MPRSPRSRSRDTSDREAQERRRLEVLYDVTRRLAAVPDSEKVLDFIVNSATTLLAWASMHGIVRAPTLGLIPSA